MLILRFGSIVVDDVNALTRTILGAIDKAGVRALVSAGWSKISSAEVSDNVFIMGESDEMWCEFIPEADLKATSLTNGCSAMIE